MEPKISLLERVRSLQTDLESAVRDLAKTRNPGLKKRLKPCFDNLVRGLRTRLSDIGAGVANGDPLAACWQKFHKLDTECVEFFGECLAFSVGDALRAPEPRSTAGCALSPISCSTTSPKSPASAGDG